MYLQIPEKNGIFDFVGSEQERVFDHLSEMSEVGLRFRCSCAREYDDDAFFRLMSSFVFTSKKQLDDWENGILRHPAHRQCRRCKEDFAHNLEIPETTWMLSFDVGKLRIRDVAQFPRFITTVSKPTIRPEDETLVKWRLAYISAVMPIPNRMESDHLVSLQFIRKNDELTRYYFDSTDGVLHPDSLSEKKMTDGQLLKKKCNEPLLTTPALPGKDTTRRAQFAVYFRIV